MHEVKLVPQDHTESLVPRVLVVLEGNVVRWAPRVVLGNRDPRDLLVNRETLELLVKLEKLARKAPRVNVVLQVQWVPLDP